MTNEELTVMSRLAEDLIASRESVKLLRSRIDKLDETFNETLKEYESARNECNRLRESEANALNAAEEAKRERDEARKKFGEWFRFINKDVFTVLFRAIDKENNHNEVIKEVVSAMKKFAVDNPVSMKGGMAI